MIMVLFLGIIASAVLSFVWDVTVKMGKYQVRYAGLIEMTCNAVSSF
jgi:hypothetical protein